MKPKAEALAALHKVWTTLDSDAPLDGLARVELKAAVKYAHAQVEAISETKRPRKAGAA